MFCIMQAEIVSWEATHRFPMARVVEEIGYVGDIEAETLAILADCEVDATEFADDVLDCLPSTVLFLSLSLSCVCLPSPKESKKWKNGPRLIHVITDGVRK